MAKEKSCRTCLHNIKNKEGKSSVLCIHSKGKINRMLGRSVCNYYTSGIMNIVVAVITGVVIITYLLSIVLMLANGNVK